MGYEPCVTTLVTVEEYCCSFNVKKHVFFLNIEVMYECPFFFFSVWLLAFRNCWLASYVIPLLTLFCVKQKYIFMLHGDNSYQYFAFNSNHNNLWPTWFCKKNDISAVRKGWAHIIANVLECESKHIFFCSFKSQ